MEIQFVKKDGKHQINMSGGWVSKQVCELVGRALSAGCWNFGAITEIGTQTGKGNFIAISIDKARDGDVQEFCDYLNIILREAIHPGFTWIMVSPYVLPDYDDHGGLTIISLISDETGCPLDAGEWGSPIRFKPIANIQYEAVIEHLNLFSMSYSNYTEHSSI